MNKLIVVSIALGLALTSGCGNDSQEVKRIEKKEATNNTSIENDATSMVDNTKEKSGIDTSDSARVYLFEDNGVQIAIDELMDPVLKKLGDPLQYYEIESCAFEGLDKMYTYAHYEVDTYPSKDGDRISAVYLKDDLVSTSEGLCIGSTKEDMMSIYGKETEIVGTEYVYDMENMKLKIQINDGLVSYIAYTSKVLQEQ